MVQGRIIPICMDSSMTESLKEETLVTQKMSSEAYRSRKLSRKVNFVDLKCVHHHALVSCVIQILRPR